MEPLLSEDWVTLKQGKHGFILYNRNDYSVGRCIDLYGEWCEREVQILLSVLGPGDVVLDVGANIGTHTVPLAKAVSGQGGMVHAFEPHHFSFQLLCANLALNRLINAKHYQRAVGQVASEVKVPVLPPWETQNFAGLRLDPNATGESVEQITIDSLSLERCSLIKVDVEGMEIDVLTGAKETVEAHKPFIFAENNTEDGSRALLELLDGFGYQCMWHLESYFYPDNFYQNPLNVFEKHAPEVNMLCFHPDRPVPEEVRAQLLPVEDLDDTCRRAIVRSGKYGFTA